MTLRGKKYKMEANYVRELSEELEKVAGLAIEQQSVIYQGNLLDGNTALEEAGVKDGDVINVVPNKKKARAAPAQEGPAAFGMDQGEAELNADGSAAGKEMGGMPGMSGMPGMPGMSGMPGMPGAGGMPGMDGFEMPSPEQYNKMMEEMLDSDVMDQYLDDPDKIEQSRVAILENPMLKQAMAQIPGFEEILNDKEKWLESMQSAKDLLKMQRDARQKGKGGPTDFGVDDLPEDDSL